MSRRRKLVIAAVALVVGFGIISVLAKEPAAEAVTPSPAPSVAAVPGTSAPSASPSTQPTSAPDKQPEPTPVATPEPTAPDIVISVPTFAELKSDAKRIAYRELFRNSEDYVYENVYFKGEVIQVLDGDEPNHYTLRVNVTHDKALDLWDDTVLVDYVGKRVLEDDIVEFVGEYLGAEQYKTVLGALVTVPAVSVTHEFSTALRLVK